MKKLNVKIKKLAHFKGELPAYQSAGASGFDVRAQISETLTLQPGQRAMVPTGLSFEIPLGYEIQARPRSGMAVKQGLSVLNTPGTIDADYADQIFISAWLRTPPGSEPIVISPGDRIAQLVFLPIVRPTFSIVDRFSASSARGLGGFGSTGVTATQSAASGSD